MERTWDIWHPSPRTTGLVEGQKNGLAIPSLQIAPDDRRGLAASSLGLDHGVPCAPFGPSLVRKCRCLRRTPKKHVDGQKNMYRVKSVKSNPTIKKYIKVIKSVHIFLGIYCRYLIECESSWRQSFSEGNKDKNGKGCSTYPRNIKEMMGQSPTKCSTAALWLVIPWTLPRFHQSISEWLPAPACSCPSGSPPRFVVPVPASCATSSPSGTCGLLWVHTVMSGRVEIAKSSSFHPSIPDCFAKIQPSELVHQTWY